MQQTLDSYFAVADVVMRAKVVKVTVPSTGHGRRGNVVADLQLQQWFKGTRGLRTVKTAVDSAACGVALREGESYWIFASHNYGKDFMQVDSCSGTRPATQSFASVPSNAARLRLTQLASEQRLNVAPKPFSDPACWQRARSFHGGELPPEIRQKIGLRRVAKSAESLELVMSPNDGYGFVVNNPNGFQSPPHIAVLTVDAEQDSMLELQLNGVTSAIEAEWINEKLIFLRAHWSSALSSDLMLDVEKGEINYLEALWSAGALPAQAAERSRDHCRPQRRQTP